MTKKKSYNPFKMLGSYVGVFIGAFLSFLSLKNFWYDFVDLHIDLNCPKIMGEFISKIPEAKEECITIYYSGNIQYLIPLQYLLYGFIGFLIGWAIHSLIRRLSK